ncbi:MAG TPA: coenzyme F420-0:L-glutamate ligase [Hyphomicrobiaceae bacterium]|nr:coenzyme F420-0:L-glutamate ligase [Hyphomicrobiaceae bacterium]
MTTRRLEMAALAGLPIVRRGDAIGSLVIEALQRESRVLKQQDVIVVAQKIISKAEGRVVALDSVTPGELAREWAGKTQKDPRLVELILSESKRVVRHRPGVLIVEHRLGFVMANAGVDQSNAGPAGQGEHAILLPVDPDESAERLRAEVFAATGTDVAVVINDSFGRPWRRGTMGIAIGAAGLPVILDLRGQPDMFGRELAVSISGFADEIAAGASLVMGQGAEGQPVVIVSGLVWSEPATTARELVRPEAEDLFR